jgi:hypothetical protein
MIILFVNALENTATREIAVNQKQVLSVYTIFDETDTEPIPEKRRRFTKIDCGSNGSFVTTEPLYMVLNKLNHEMYVEY